MSANAPASSRATRPLPPCGGELERGVTRLRLTDPSASATSPFRRGHYPPPHPSPARGEGDGRSARQPAILPQTHATEALS